jgi:hypothetical protein
VSLKRDFCELQGVFVGGVDRWMRWRDSERDDGMAVQKSGRSEGGRKGDWGPGMRYKEWGCGIVVRTLFPIMPAVRLTTRRRRSSHAICRSCSPPSLLFYSNALLQLSQDTELVLSPLLPT